MRAVVYGHFGSTDVLHLEDVPAPPRTSGVEVQIRASAINPKDVLIRKGKLRWAFRGPFPRVPGFDFVGDVDGQRVFAMIPRGTGGAHADLVRLPRNQLAAAPQRASDAEVASLPLAGQTALQALRNELRVRPGQHLLVNGASGGVGTLAVQIARILGAKVTAICSQRNADFLLDLGADAVLPYDIQPLADERFDAIFDVFGNLPWALSQRHLNADGRYCTTVPRPGSIARGLLARLGLSRAHLVVVQNRRADLDQLADWVNTGQLRPIVDRTYPLEECASAHAYIETKRARGKLVLLHRSAANAVDP